MNLEDQHSEELLRFAAQRRTSRRHILRGLSLGALTTFAGVTFAGCDGSDNSNTTGTTGTGTTGTGTTGTGTTGTGTTSTGPSVSRDIDILNFALNLEYLEAEFYTYATIGAGIGTQGIVTTGQNGIGTTITAGTTTGGVKVPFDSPVLNAVALQLAEDERAHVMDLRNTIITLGGTPAAKPNINLAALLPQGVDISTLTGFLMASLAFEDTGVSAYGGAARYIASPDILQASARILAVEAYHAANIREQIRLRSIASPALDGLDVPPPPTGSNPFTVDANALSIIRTPRQVLNIVLAVPTTNPNATTGGFFPNGVNANLTTVGALGTTITI